MSRIILLGKESQVHHKMVITAMENSLYEFLQHQAIKYIGDEHRTIIKDLT